jgi:hypothetical protein
MRAKSASGRRVLALDVKPHWSGYAVFESPTQLLDAGTVTFRTSKDAEARFAFLMRTFCPRVLVLREIRSQSPRDNPDTRLISGYAGHAARRSSIATVLVSERLLRGHFEAQGAHTKHQVASLLARTFPDLEWKLPPPRKLWQTERPRMSVFGAVALGATYLALQGLNQGGDEIL